MNNLKFMIVTLVIVLIVNTIMWARYKDAEKIDKGFVLNYHKLTYRRKLLRTLWGIPYVLCLYLIIYWLDDLTSNEYIFFGAILLILLFIEIVYNYVKWKKDEKEE